MRLFRLAPLAVTAFAATSVLASAPDPATLTKIAALSVPFVPNAGQWNEHAAFAAKTFAGTLFVTKDGQLIYSLPGKPVGQDVNARSASPEQRTPGWVLSETLVDEKGRWRPMSQSTLKAPAGYRPMEGKVSYGIGNDPSKHADNLNTYERVNLGDMYPGVNVQLRATGNNVEKIFTVAPRQDPAQINIKLAGANKLEIGNKGELVAHTGNGPVTFTAPIAFQEIANGDRAPVAVAYVLNADQQRYGFTLGHYDATRPLIIDPLLQSTYHGGNSNENASALAIHPATGEVYIAGYTGSTDLPGVAGGAQSGKSTGDDAFVTRFNAALTSRLQSSYLGGTGGDYAYALAIHPATGEVYVAGYTGSTDLPGVAGGAQSGKSTGDDAFVTRLNAALTSRLQSSYLGGTGDDYATALAIHPVTGEVYVAGSTSSTDLPGVAGGAQSGNSAVNDAFVSRFSLDLAGPGVVPNPFTFASRLNVPISSLQTSNATQISGVVGAVPVSITGGNFGEYCVSSGAACSCDVRPFASVAATLNNNQYVCVRQVAPAFTPGQIKTTLVVGGGWADFIVSTGTQITSCNLDIDGSGGAPNAASDGLMLVRAMLGFTGTAVTNGAIIGTPPRNTWPLIRDYLNQNCGTNFGP